MPKAAANEPPLDLVAQALREVTELLASEISAPTGTVPAWSDFKWRVAEAVATMHGMSSILHEKLLWQGPPRWRRFLAAQREHTSVRHHRIIAFLRCLDGTLQAAGLGLVGLKGTALHARGIYQAGDRPMADVDLLVDDAKLDAATQLMEQQGYRITLRSWRNLMLEPASDGEVAAADGEHGCNPIKVEFHTCIKERLPLTETDITRCLAPSTPNPGLSGYRSDAALMLHLLLHAAGNMRAHALRLIQLHDIALLAARFDRSDWEELLGFRPEGDSLWWALPPLQLTQRYYPDSISPSVMDRFAKSCPWMLERSARHQILTDVSWSNINVYALPGIGWSRTPAEALRFAASRVFPSREERRELMYFATHHPGAAKVPWYGISQGARVLRWMFSKPPRVQTLLSVRAALSRDN